MTGILKGKVALVTGAGGGIGLAAAKAFAEAGASVVLADRDEQLISKSTERIRSAAMADKSRCPAVRSSHPSPPWR